MKSVHKPFPSPRRVRWFTSLCAACLLTGVTLSDLSAQTAATWNGGTGNWSNAALWSTGAAPNGASFDVFIDGGKTGVNSVVTMDNTFTAGRLTVDAGDTLNLANGVTFVLASSFNGSESIINNGTINLNSTGNLTDLRYSGANASLTGTGTLNLVSNSRIFDSNGNGARLTIGAGSTVAGAGNLGASQSTFTNNGTINANVNGGTLIIQPGGGTGDFTNGTAGVARASNGGVLQLFGGGATFAGGTFQALAGSTVNIGNSAIVSGATLSTAGSGQVVVTDAATLTNVTNNGTLGVNNSASAVLTGTLTNNGTVNVNSTGNLTDLRFVGATTLAGTGTVNLVGANARIFGNSLNGERLTIGAGQTISGQGNLGVGKTTFTNNGTVNANVSGATLTIQPGSGNGNDFTNAASGVLSASNGGTLALDGSTGGVFNLGGAVQALAGSTVSLASNPTLTNTTLTTSGSGQVVVTDAATLTNVTNNGTLSVNNGSTIVPTGTLTNNGTINLNSTSNLTDLRFVGATTLAGTGAINLIGSNSRLFASNGGGDRLTVSADSTIAGAGNLGASQSTFTNNGTINANVSGGTLLIQPGGGTGDFTNGTTGVAQASNGGILELAAGGTFSGNAFTALEGSRVQVDSGATVSNATFTTGGTGVVTLDRSTLVNVTNRGNLVANNNASVTLSGTFTNIGTFNLNSTGDGVSVRLAGPVTLEGDYFGVSVTNLNGPNVRIFATNAGDRLTIGNYSEIAGQGNLGGGTTTFTNGYAAVAANINGGTLTIEPGGGTADFTNNGGFLAATNGGTLQFSNASGGVLNNNGTLAVSEGSTLNVSAGALSNLSGGTLTGGTYSVFAANAARPATLSLGNSPIITNKATVQLSGPGAVFNDFNTLAANAGMLFLNKGGNFTTAGALDNTRILSVNYFDVNYTKLVNPATSTLTVTGNLNNSKDGQVFVADGAIAVRGDLTNAGPITLFSASTLSVQGNMTNAGSVQIVPNASNQGAVVTVQGTLTSSGRLIVGYSEAPGNVTVAGVLSLTSSGSLLGSGSVTAPTLTLAGTVRPGDFGNIYSNPVAGGTLALNGQVELTSSSVLIFDLASTAVSARLAVNGVLTLDGTLNVNALAGFGVGRYDLIDYSGALTNNTLDLGMLPAGYNYAIDTSIAGQVNLVVTNAVPEPSTWAAVLVGLALLSLLRRRSGAC